MNKLLKKFKPKSKEEIIYAKNLKLDNFIYVKSSSNYKLLDKRIGVEYNLDKLSKKEKRKLYNYIRKKYYVHKHEILDCVFNQEFYISIYQLYEKAGLNYKEIRNHWIHNWNIQNEITKSYEKKPIVEKKDNKDIHVGSGNYNRNSIRYPSLKRSKSVWKKFYKLFPYAERRKKV